MTTQREVDDLSSENYSLKEENWRIQNAERAGMEILRGDPHTLLFDLDGEQALAEFRTRVVILEHKAFDPKIEITRSKSGNYHAVVKIHPDRPPIPEALRIAIQSCLGSDWKREFLGALRNLNNQESVSLLFRPMPLQLVVNETSEMAELCGFSEAKEASLP